MNGLNIFHCAINFIIIYISLFAYFNTLFANFIAEQNYIKFPFCRAFEMTLSQTLLKIH